ncbi:excinuclease ABC subunit C, partial [Pseudoalteromonas tunicata D2]
MEKASLALNFELAAKIRDQILLLRKMQEQQSVSGNFAEMDVIGYQTKNGLTAVHLLMIRDHKILGSNTFFPKIPKDSIDDEILSSFIAQYYLSVGRSSRIAKEIILPFAIADTEVLNAAISQVADKKVHLKAV